MSNTEKKRKKWDFERMKLAVAAVKEKKMGYLKAAKTFGVPKSTLENYVNDKTKDVDELCNTRMGRKCVLGEDLEKDLVKYCKKMEETFYGVTVRDIKQLAFQLAVKNNVDHPFPLAKGAAGKKWLRNFLKRNPTLSLRKPQSMALARAKGFTQANVKMFYDLLEPELKKVNMKPNKVFNVDETGITVVQSRRSKVLAVKGKKQIGTLSAQERGALMTIVTCMSPAGIFIPPLIVFPRKNMKPELLNGTPPGTIARCHKSGWIQSNIFTDWVQHFIDYVKPTPEDPVVLILDGHGTHVRNIDVILKARENGVIIVCLPPHTSHKLQPMDVSFMSPFKAYYSQEVETWLSNNPFRSLSCYQVGELMGKAYAKCATLQIAENGFKKCGILPFDKNKFEESDFIEMDTEVEPLPREIQPSVSFPDPEPQPSTSTAEQFLSPTTPKSSSSSENRVSPFCLKPVPKLPVKSSNPKRGRPAGKAAVITSSPYKINLEGELKKSQEKEKISQEKNKKKKEIKKQLSFKRGKKRTLKLSLPHDTSDEESDVPYVSTDDEDSADEECLYCCQPFKEDKCGEQWIRCVKCFRWAHELCSGSEKKAWKTFTCEACNKYR
jgi:hypothetical protein